MRRTLGTLAAAGVLLVVSAIGPAVGAATAKDQLYNCTNGTTDQNDESARTAKELEKHGYVCWGQEEKRKYKYYCTNGDQHFYTIRELVKLRESQGYTCRREDMPIQG